MSRGGTNKRQFPDDTEGKLTLMKTSFPGDTVDGTELPKRIYQMTKWRDGINDSNYQRTVGRGTWWSLGGHFPMQSNSYWSVLQKDGSNTLEKLSKMTFVID